MFGGMALDAPTAAVLVAAGIIVVCCVAAPRVRRTLLLGIVDTLDALEGLFYVLCALVIVAAKGLHTERTRVFDIVRQHAWPQPYTGRAIRNRFMERWGRREDDLGVALDEEIPRFRAAVRDGDFDTAMIWAGEGVDLISDVAPAGELVRRIGTETEARLRHASELLGKT